MPHLTRSMVCTVTPGWQDNCQKVTSRYKNGWGYYNKQLGSICLSLPYPYFPPIMLPMQYIVMKLNKTSAESWMRIGNISYATTVGPLSREVAYSSCRTRTYAFLSTITGIDYKEADTDFCLTHLSVSQLLCTFNSFFPQKQTWRLFLLTCGEKHQMLKIIHTKRLLWDSAIPQCRNNIPHECSGDPSAPSCS